MKSWLYMAALFVLCGVLGVLQYQWVGEFSVGVGERARTALTTNLARLSQDFNSEILTAMLAVVPLGVEDAESAKAGLVRRFGEAKETRVFRRLGLAIPEGDKAALLLIDRATGRLDPADWPEAWESIRERIEYRLASPGAGPPGSGPGASDDLVFEAPLFEPGPDHRRGPGRGPGWPPGPGRGFGRRELAWVVFELNPDHIRDAMLPEIVQRHLDTSEYLVEVVARSNPDAVLWASDEKAGRVAKGADASAGLFDARLTPFPEGGRGRGGRGGPPGRGRDGGRWVAFVRHRAGSLDAVVAQTRWRNLGVTGGVLLLLIATVMALFRYMRNAQQLAHMQMDFVAGVSHELRTPLTAIYTAGHNLRGHVAQNPAQVERYGAMIQQESGRLRDLVEQALRFASANAGRVIQTPTPMAVAGLIEESVESSRCAMQSAGFTVEKRIEEGLPEILADPLALKHALQNLLANAVKYGAADDPWIGVFASATKDGVEIRVADRGPGIPVDEQKHIFDAFYRGRRAVQDQIHGAGLGLNLVKKIVEAHGGSIRVKSTPGEGAEFVVRIPAAAGA
jgi:signal transduction histidine kinase